MSARLAELIWRRGRAVLVTAAVLALLGGAASATLFDKLTAGGLTDPTTESGRAAAVLARSGQGAPNLTLLVTAPAGVDDATATEAGTRLTRKLAEEPGVRDVSSYWTAGRAPQLRSEDGGRALVVATVAGDETAAGKRLDTLLPRYEGEQDGLDVAVGGYAVFQQEAGKQTQQDGAKGELIAFPVTLVILFVVFGSVVSALLPLIVAFVALLVGMGLMWILASVTDLSVFALSVVTLLGLGLAVDYCLLMVTRYRDELRTAPRREALRTTMVTAGRTVAFSAVTVAVVLAGLLFFPLPAVRSMAYAGMLTALLSAGAALTVLPALFVVLGARVESRRGGSARERTGFWHRLALFVMRRPVPVVTVALAFLILLGAPALGMRLGMADERSMPESSKARQVATAIREGFDSGELNALQVVAPEAELAEGGPAEEVAGYAARLSRLPHAARVDSVAGSYAKGALVSPASPAHERFVIGGGTYLSVVPASAADAKALVGEVRSLDAPFETLVGGIAAVDRDTTRSLADRLPYALGAVALAMVVLLFLLTGSVLLPVLALMLSGLSLTATFGALVWIFQEGHLASLLGGFTVTGTIASIVPVMLFALSFGLAMDYQVFMLARIREEYERTGSPTAAVAMGLERVGRMVTAAAVLISVVFLAFLVSGITFVKAYGVGLPLAVLMDATLIRGALLPAAMRLGGRATWWAPAPLRRLHRRYAIREGEAPGTREARPAEQDGLRL
ncbi:MMPL family transporter [Streptomyces roseirectus]|uniref:MMPL family transporter n=1 Tax=Streptomyces roseirectus TaxID=2768066 RepID=A0A7H0IMP6_9ACTN|nr:MMPL family transporter [Streptomyces roseirectus]QNP74062.1 MMPL family transporter [Streptomyces roseirectus]